MEAVQERRNALQPLPDAQALRGLLVDAAKRAARVAEEVPSAKPVGTFLVRHTEGKPVAEIAEELGVSREWCSRSYKKQALRMAGIQFVRLVS